MFVQHYVHYDANDEYLPLFYQDPSCFKTKEERSSKDAIGRLGTRNRSSFLEKSKDNVPPVYYCKEIVFETLQHHNSGVKLPLSSSRVSQKTWK
mmetsp:Transcript_5849/g.36261  ORF Transcript_5849/g.36261 Transcript_5849/m.36261 type:complete len:94 (+) Transcript_5849:8457-8738(+)